MNAWCHWWFVHGGSIHGEWKRRNYSRIRTLANDLPKLAWDQATKLSAERIRELESDRAELIEALRNAIEIQPCENARALITRMEKKT